MIKRYFIEFAFLGSSYHGWQIQPNANTVQELMQESLSTLLREEIVLTGAGRTDSGVHASYFTAHFDSAGVESEKKLAAKLNRFLGPDISIFNLVQVPETAHARFDAISRTYKYVIVRKKHPFLEKLSLFVHEKLDMEAMEEATELIRNTEDFSSFAKLHSDNKNNLCEIKDASWITENEILIFRIEANRFLRNMIRALTATLLDVGKGNISYDTFREIVLSKNNQNASASAAAKGLFLSDVKYPESYNLKNPRRERVLPFL